MLSNNILNSKFAAASSISGGAVYFASPPPVTGGGRAVRSNVLASLRAFHCHPLLLRACRPVALRAAPCAFNWVVDVFSGCGDAMHIGDVETAGQETSSVMLGRGGDAYCGA